TAKHTSNFSGGTGRLSRGWKLRTCRSRVYLIPQCPKKCLESFLPLCGLKRDCHPDALTGHNPAHNTLHRQWRTERQSRRKMGIYPRPFGNFDEHPFAANITNTAPQRLRSPINLQVCIETI